MTIYDIAREAGVSPSSVSRVINKKPGVKEENRKRVLELLDVYGFVPNAIAKGLVSKASETVGILITDLRVSHHVGGVYYVQKELSDHGYCSLIINTGMETKDKVKAIRELEYRRVDGVIMMGGVFQCEEVREAIERSLAAKPVVMVNGWLDLPNVSGIVVDEKQATEKCARMLQQCGRRRIGFIYDNGQNPSVEAKRKGFEAAFTENTDMQHWSYIAENDYEDGYRTGRLLLEEHPETDAILCSLDILAAGAILALREKGISIPEQVSVMGMNNSIFAQVCYPPLSSLDTKRNEAGVMAADLLIDMMKGHKVEKRVELSSEIVLRGST